MCGIGGIISSKKITKQQGIFFQNMLKELQSRGRHAFGYVKFPKTSIFKTAGDVDDYLESGKKDIWSKIVGSNTVLGHTRAVTKGDATKNRNNHPFNTVNFTLAHNGTITNDKRIRNFLKVSNYIETDSYSIVKLIQHYYDLDENKNVIEAIKKTRSTIDGGYACWLLHKDTGDVYLFKGINGELTLAYLDPWDCYIFASSVDNFLNLTKDVFKNVKKKFGLFNTSILLRKLKDTHIYKISPSKNKDKGDWGEMYDYEYDNEYRLGIEYDNDEADESKVVAGYNDCIDTFDTDPEPTTHDVYRKKSKYPKIIRTTTEDDETDNLISKLNSVDIDTEINKNKVKLFIPVYAIKMIKNNGYTLGGNDKNTIKVKIDSCKKNMIKIEGLMLKHFMDKFPSYKEHEDREHSNFDRTTC